MCANKRGGNDVYIPRLFDAIGFPIQSNWNTPGIIPGIVVCVLYTQEYFLSLSLSPFLPYPTVANKNRLLPHKIAANLFQPFDFEIERQTVRENSV